ncbi:hypothetical protein CMO91_00895 [Candidatus Woesearchaeota archaeon]|nr:hypothetical protein [Candidatus Woesearchaeota archaeon]
MDNVKQKLSQLEPVIVIGDLMLDQYHGGTMQPCPEGGEKFVVEKTHNVLGGAGNVARNLRALDVPVHVIGALGKDDLDDAGITILRLLEEIGCTHTIIKSAQPTTVKARLYNHQGTRSGPRLDKDMVFEKKQEFLHQVRHDLAKYKNPSVIISDYGKGVVSNDLMDLLCAMRLKTFVDPKPASNVNYTFKDFPYVLRPNKQEAKELAARHKTNLSTIPEVAQALQEKGAQNVIITLSEQGMYILDQQGYSLPTLATECVDVTGAGDTVMAALVAFDALGLPLRQCCQLASVAAAIVVGKKGTATATVDEVLKNAPPPLDFQSEKFI